MAQGFIYLTAVLAWFTRHVRAWRVSMALEADFCMDAVEEALACHGTPEIFTPDSHADAAKIVLTGPLRYEAGGMFERECDDGEDGFFDLSDRYARLGMPIGSRWSRSTHRPLGGVSPDVRAGLAQARGGTPLAQRPEPVQLNRGTSIIISRGCEIGSDSHWVQLRSGRRNEPSPEQIDVYSANSIIYMRGGERVS